MREPADSNKILTEHIHENIGIHHQGGRRHAHYNMLILEPHGVIVKGMGPRGIKSFQDARVAVLRANSSSVESVLETYIKGIYLSILRGVLPRIINNNLLQSVHIRKSLVSTVKVRLGQECH